MLSGYGDRRTGRSTDRPAWLILVRQIGLAARRFQCSLLTFTLWTLWTSSFNHRQDAGP